MYDGTEGRIRRRKERIVTLIIVLLFLFIIIFFTTGCTTLKTAFTIPTIELRTITEADILHNKYQYRYLYCPIQPPASTLAVFFCVIQSCLKKIKNRAAVSTHMYIGVVALSAPRSLPRTKNIGDVTKPTNIAIYGQRSFAGHIGPDMLRLGFF